MAGQTHIDDGKYNGMSSDSVGNSGKGHPWWAWGRPRRMGRGVGVGVRVGVGVGVGGTISMWAGRRALSNACGAEKADGGEESLEGRSGSAGRMGTRVGFSFSLRAAHCGPVPSPSGCNGD
jgi:hypothetical protein